MLKKIPNICTLYLEIFQLCIQSSDNLMKNSIIKTSIIFNNVAQRFSNLFINDIQIGALDIHFSECPIEFVESIT